MYSQLAIIGLFVFIYSLIAGRVGQSFISGPMIFVTVGFLLGPFGLDWLTGDATSNDLRVMADLTLALILFTDAANSDMSVLRRQFRIPSRMLLLGLPGAIALGFGTALLLFDVLSVYEAVILATMLAATDAALGAAVISNKAVPARLREGLNVESGLNDGLCVPVILFFIALSVGGDAQGHPASALELVTKELGIGMTVGAGLALFGVTLLHWCWKHGWVTEAWIQVTVVGLAFTSFAFAQSLDGSGYIAAFTGGMLFGAMAKEKKHTLIVAAEGIGKTFALVTWLLFGALVIAPAFSLLTWDVALYAVLSLTIIRILPIYLSLTGLGESNASKLFLGWFGPRGLASVVVSIIVISAGVPNAEFIVLVVFCTVLLSLIAHGISANPLAKWIGKRDSE